MQPVTRHCERSKASHLSSCCAMDCFAGPKQEKPDAMRPASELSLRDVAYFRLFIST
jgi:hypothetical protein